MCRLLSSGSIAVRLYRAVPVLTESSEPLYLFVLSHYPTQNRFALLLEMLWRSGKASGMRGYR
nr:hypothetical protein [Brucella abortus]